MEINSITSFIEVIGDFKKDNPHTSFYFRGQKNGTKEGWNLIPGFYRMKGKYTQCEFFIHREEEYNCIYKFIEKNHEYINELDYDDLLGILNILQHYGFPTRLLDVTSNPLIALYFALEDICETDNPVVFMIGTKKCHSSYIVNKDLVEFYDKPKYEKSEITMVNANRNSKRIKQQNGDFILFYDNNDISTCEDFEVYELRIDLSKIDNLKNELDVLNINKYTVYPSLENEVRRFLNELNISKSVGEVVNKLEESLNKGASNIDNTLKNVANSRVDKNKKGIESQKNDGKKRIKDIKIIR